MKTRPKNWFATVEISRFKEMFHKKLSVVSSSPIIRSKTIKLQLLFSSVSVYENSNPQNLKNLQDLQKPHPLIMKFSTNMFTTFIVLVYVSITFTEAKPQNKSFKHRSEVEKTQVTHHLIDQVESRLAMLSFLNGLKTITPTRYEPKDSTRRTITHSKRSVRSNLRKVMKKDLKKRSAKQFVARKNSKKTKTRFVSLFPFSVHHLF